MKHGHRSTGQSLIGSGMLDGNPKEILDDCPMIKAHGERIEALWEVKKWRSADAEDIENNDLSLCHHSGMGRPSSRE